MLKQLEIIKTILLKKGITQLILLIATILRVIFLQKEFVLKTKIFNSNLFVKSLIDNLIINQLTKFVLFKLCIFYINLLACRKSTKTK